MAATRSAKKSKNDGGSGDDSGDENLWSSMGGGGPSDIVTVVAAMQKEMEEMQRRMAKMEGGVKDLKETNKILEKKLSYIEDKNKKLLEAESKMNDLNERLKKDRDVADARCNRMEKSLTYHRYLIKNQQWKNPVPTIPSSYWAPNGYNEETAADLKELVKKIRGRTKYMRVDGENGKIGVSKAHDGRNILYDDVLLPQWKEFANALRQYRHFIDQCPETDTDEPWLDICYAQLPRQILDLFEEALADTHFNTISFVSNNAGRDMTSFLSNIAKSNPKLEILSSDGNPIQDEQDFQALVDTISAHPSLRVLKLVDCCRELSYDTITSLLSSTHQLEMIDLSFNGISTLGNTFLEGYLEENTSLKALNLRENNLNDFDAKSIARGLGKNDVLFHLDVSGNNITGHGKETLLRAVFDSTTLHSAARSNHSCHVKCDNDERLKTFNRSPGNKKSNRRQKLYSILSSRNKESNNVVQLGEHITKKHIPAVLDAVQKYSEVDYSNQEESDVVPPLSVVYEILRGWSMPVLYEDV